jgi:hypothetical protein
MRDDELIDKFLGCLAWADIPEATGRAVATRLLALDEEGSIADVVAPLRRAAVEAA